MKNFKKMQSDSESVVEIKQQEDQCHHRIAELYSHPNCEKLAQICEKRCKSSLIHDMTKTVHDRKTVDQFKGKFNRLQAIFTDLAQNYAMQLDQIEKRAINSIAKKKVDCLNEIVEYKKELMKQTYSDLTNRFPHLYEKFISKRLDTLNCNEVSWVMKTEVRHHNQKHSAMGTKFVAIVKKFESFKDISKNLPQKLFTNKQNAKDMKIVSKSSQQQHVVRLKANISIERPNFQQEKTRQELQYLQNKKRELEYSIKSLTMRNNKLSDELSRRIYQKRQMQIRGKITGKVIDWHFENINRLAKPSNNKLYDDQSDSESSSSLSPQIYPKAPLVNPYPTILPITNKERLAENRENPTANTQVVQKDPQQNRMINQASQNTQKASEKVVIPQQVVPIPQENKEKIDEKVPQDKENSINQPIIPQVPAQPQPNQQNVVSMQAQEQLPKRGDSKDKEKPLAQVKKQHTEGNDFHEWNNKQLVTDIKRYGKNEQQGLKVEYIEGLRSFSDVRLPSTKLKINPFLKKINKVETAPSKSLQYQDLAKVLMEQYMNSKQKEKDDKDRRL